MVRFVCLAAVLAACFVLAGVAHAATTAEINSAWDSAASLSPILPISNLPDSTPLTQVVTSGGQAALDAQLSRMLPILDASARPEIDLDTATVGDVRLAIEFTSA